MKDEITGREIKEGIKVLFVDYRNWNPNIFHKDITLERIKELTGKNFTKIPPIVIINKPQ